MRTWEATVGVAVGIDLSHELDDDHVGLWKVVKNVRHTMRSLYGVNSPRNTQVRRVTRAILEGLVASGARVGLMDESTEVFTAWPTAEAIDRALAGWKALGRDPNIGEVAWLVRDWPADRVREQPVDGA